MLAPHELGRLAVYGEDLAARPDAVMAFGETTLVPWQATEPPRPIASALDLGCGAGALALLLARRATTSIASGSAGATATSPSQRSAST